MFSRRYRGIWFAGLALGALALIWFVPARMDDQLPRKIGPQPDGTILVPTNQLLSPAGFQLYFPGRPVDLALSPDRSLLAVKNMEGIVLVRMKDRTILQTLPVPTGGQGFVGILFAPDGKSIYTTDSEGRIHIARLASDNVLTWDKSHHPSGPHCGGRQNPRPQPDQSRQESFVSRGHVPRCRPRGAVGHAQPQQRSRPDRSEEPQPDADSRRHGTLFTVLPGPGDKLYVSNWAGRRPKPGEPVANSSGSPVLVNPQNGVAASGTVSVVDRAARAELRTIEVGLHPSGMTFNSDKSRLFVANANSDTVSVIDTESDQVVETISVIPERGRPFGSAPNALTLSKDDGTLYVANGTDNAVCVVRLGTLSFPRSARGPRQHDSGFHPHGLVSGSGDTRQRAQLSDRRQHQGNGQPESAHRPERVQFARSLRLAVFYSSARCRGTQELFRPGGAQQRHARHPGAAGRKTGSTQAAPGSRESRRTFGVQARPLHHQGEPDLRPGVRRPAPGGRRSQPGALRPRGDTQSSRPGRGVRAARQLLLQRRAQRRRPPVGHRGLRDRLPGEELRRLQSQLSLRRR